MTRAEQITTRLKDAFDPEHLDVVDDSEMHRGHAGFQEGGESHFRVKMVSAALAGQSRIAQHRAPHAPNASPCEVCSVSPSSIAAINVATANSPEPSPIKNAPAKKSVVDPIGAETITAGNASSPTKMLFDINR